MEEDKNSVRGSSVSQIIEKLKTELAAKDELLKRCQIVCDNLENIAASEEAKELCDEIEESLYPEG